MDQSIDAVRVRPAPAGKVVDWTFRMKETGPTLWDWTLGPPDVYEVLPIRTSRSTEKSRHIPVQAHCFVTGTMLKLESGLEYDLLLMLEREPGSVWMVPQPVRLGIKHPGRPRTIHTPDLLVLDSAGEVTIWNARSSERQDEKFHAQSQATANACRDAGWRYSVFSGHSRAKRYNLRWLAAYRRAMPWYEAARNELRDLSSRSSATTGDVVDADRGSGHLVSAMWHFVWRGDVIVDLEHSIRRTAPIAWATDPSDG